MSNELTLDLESFEHRTLRKKRIFASPTQEPGQNSTRHRWVARWVVHIERVVTWDVTPSSIEPCLNQNSTMKDVVDELVVE
jgi:hypothetical protein